MKNIFEYYPGQMCWILPDSAGEDIDIDPDSFNITSSNPNVISSYRGSNVDERPILALQMHNVGSSVITFRDPKTGHVLKKLQLM